MPQNVDTALLGGLCSSAVDLDRDEIRPELLDREGEPPDEDPAASELGGSDHRRVDVDVAHLARGWVGAEEAQACGPSKGAAGRIAIWVGSASTAGETLTVSSRTRVRPPGEPRIKVTLSDGARRPMSGTQEQHDSKERHELLDAQPQLPDE
jgi:hypothetical protein